VAGKGLFQIGRPKGRAEGLDATKAGFIQFSRIFFARRISMGAAGTGPRRGALRNISKPNCGRGGFPGFSISGGGAKFPNFNLRTGRGFKVRWEPEAPWRKAWGERSCWGAGRPISVRRWEAEIPRFWAAVHQRRGRSVCRKGESLETRGALDAAPSIFATRRLPSRGLRPAKNQGASKNGADEPKNGLFAEEKCLDGGKRKLTGPPFGIFRPIKKKKGKGSAKKKEKNPPALKKKSSGKAAARVQWPLSKMRSGGRGKPAAQTHSFAKFGMRLKPDHPNGRWKKGQYQKRLVGPPCRNRKSRKNGQETNSAKKQTRGDGN